MTRNIEGLHHVTAVASDAQVNVDFYTGVLGMALVKQTVDVDNPFTYRLTYAMGDGLEAPLLSFLIHPEANGAQVGAGQFASITCAIPASSFGYWLERLLAHGIGHTHPATRFGERYISLADPDGLRLELLADPASSSPVVFHCGQTPNQHAIRAIRGVSLWDNHPDQSITFFKDALGFSVAGREGTSQRLSLSTGKRRCTVDLVNASGLWSGTPGIGGIDHIAWSTPNLPALEEAKARLADLGVEPSPVVDAYYSQTVTFNAPGGSRQQIATREPGLLVDEPMETLGQHLQLPPWLESNRLGIESSLPPIQTPTHSPNRPETFSLEDSPES